MLGNQRDVFNLNKKEQIEIKSKKTLYNQRHFN